MTTCPLVENNNNVICWNSTENSRSHYRRTSSGPLPEVNNNDPHCHSNHRHTDERKSSTDGATAASASMNGLHREYMMSSGRRSRDENPCDVSACRPQDSYLNSQQNYYVSFHSKNLSSHGLLFLSEAEGLRPRNYLFIFEFSLLTTQWKMKVLNK